MRRKKIIALCVAVCMLVCASGCSSRTAEMETYSNMADKSSRDQVAAVFEENDIPEETSDRIFRWVDDFNSITTSYEPVGKFEALPEKGPDYRNLIMDDSSDVFSYMQWLNCRLTAYTLLKDKIETDRSGDESDNWIMFDMEALDTVPEFKATDDEKSDFATVFNHVSVAGTSSVEEHKEKIKKAWEERDIKIASDSLSLVCIYVHDPEEQARFVGHTGVLAETDGGLLFFEKYSPLAPFQATYFSDRKELKKYLLSRDDIYGDEKELEPVVTENGVSL